MLLRPLFALLRFVLVGLGWVGDAVDVVEAVVEIGAFGDGVEVGAFDGVGAAEVIAEPEGLAVSASVAAVSPKAVQVMAAQ